MEGASCLHSVVGKNGEGSACTIEIEGVKVATVSRLPLYTLPYFKSHSNLAGKPDTVSEQSKSKANLVYEQAGGEMLLKGPTLFDVSHLDRLELSSVRFLLVCDYRDLLIVPFLTRNRKFQAKVLLTQPMWYFGRLLMNQFISFLKNASRSKESLSQPDFFEESYAYGLFEERYGHRVEDWQQIYSEAEADAMWLRCVRLNYGQVHSEYGLDVAPYSSGTSMATAMWLLQDQRTKYTLVYAENLSVHSWRHCISAEVARLQHWGTIHSVVLGGSCIKSQPQTTTEQLKVFLEDIEKCLRSGRTCTVQVDDLLDVLDLADILQYKIQTAYKHVYIYNLLFQAMVKYGNSLVEYLNPYLKGKIFTDPPVYPFSSLDGLADAGRLSYGNMAKAATDNRVSLKELQIRHNPALNFQLGMDQLLKRDSSVIPTHRKTYDRRPTASQLQQWLDQLKPLKVYSLSDETSRCNVIQVQHQSRTKLDSLKQFHYQCQNWNGFPIRSFVLADNQLKPSKGEPQSILIASTAWQQRLFDKLSRLGLEVQPPDQSPCLKTRHSKIELNQYTFCISSSSSQEAALLYKQLTELCQRVYLT